MNNEITPEIREQILDWVESIPERLIEGGVGFPPDIKLGTTSKDWSRPAINTLYKEHLCRWAGELPPAIDWERDSYAEGVKTLSRKDRGGQFFGSECWPDLALRSPIRIAIELDHGKDGKNVRDALTKASFNVIVGDWEWCYVLFFVEPGGELAKRAASEKDQQIRAAYELLFRTKVLFVYLDKDHKVIAGKLS